MLLKPAVNSSAYLKLGIMGFEGSGKTRTAIEIAIGMTKLVKGKKVAFFDTEKGSDFHIARFKAEEIQFDRIKSKSFVDLIDVIREAERGQYSFLIIDSITHVWRELTDSYLKKKRKDRLSMPDWGVLKTEWSQFTDLYVNSKVHIAMLGRAGHNYEMSEDEDGKMQVHKEGIKMRVEAETGYEPDLLIEMEKIRKPDGKGFINRATVTKDRTDTLNGMTFDSPTFKSFEPIMKFLNIGGEHEGSVNVQSSQIMFGNPDRSLTERMRQMDISLGKRRDTHILAGLDGSSAEVKGKRTKVLVDLFGGSGETHLKGLKLEMLNEGIAKIQEQFKIGLTSPKADVTTAEDAAL